MKLFNNWFKNFWKKSNTGLLSTYHGLCVSLEDAPSFLGAMREFKGLCCTNFMLIPTEHSRDHKNTSFTMFQNEMSMKGAFVFLQSFMDSPVCRPGVSETGGLISRRVVVLWVSQAKQQYPSTKVTVGAHFIRTTETNYGPEYMRLLRSMVVSNVSQHPQQRKEMGSLLDY